MGNTYAICVIVCAVNIAFVACGGSGGSDGGNTRGTTAHGGHGGETGATSVIAGSGGAGTTIVTGGATPLGSTGSMGGSGTGGDIGDAGADVPDVSFTYDADIGDGAVSADSACAAEVNAGKKRPVDIIWVVDTSGSMSEEIAQIKANIQSQFADILSASGLDYQVIMLADRGLNTFQVCAPPPLGGPNCGDNPPLYHAIDQIVASTDSLSLILSTYDSANPALNWAHHLRMNAVKVFIEVTDDNSVLTGATFDAQLLAKLPAGMFGTATNRNYIFHSIIGVTAGSPGVKCSSAINIGLQYQVVSNLTGGLMLPVCEASFSPIFQQIAGGIAGSLACEFLMPTASGGAAIDPNNVAMRYTPPGGAPIDIPRVADASQCAGDGWYYDDNQSPTKLVLCPMTCATAESMLGAKVDILVGCLSG